MASLRNKLASAGELQSVVRTMKAMAASSISQYEQSVQALASYHRTVELGLGACLRGAALTPSPAEQPPSPENNICAIIFGSDQGLVGQFNEVVAEHALTTLTSIPGTPHLIVIGERLHARLVDVDQQPVELFTVPGSVKAITPFVGRLQIAIEAQRANAGCSQVFIIHNRPQSGALSVPSAQKLLPFDATWKSDLMSIPWPTRLQPELIYDAAATLRTLIHEYLFISLFRACAESLASENASRLSAMERADKNISDLLATMRGEFHHLRQSAIDEELFDVIAGFEAFSVNR